MATNQIRKEHVRKLVSELYTADIGEIVQLKNGDTNQVFMVHTLGHESDVVVRLSRDHTKINDYLKEQWCVKVAKEAGVPVPEVLEVGNHIVPFPYYVAKFKKGVSGNAFKGNRKELYRQMGEIVSKIHSIKTKGFGRTFDWSHNQLSKHRSWREYLENDLKVDEVANFLADHKVIDEKCSKKFRSVTDSIKEWSFKPVLVHNDFLTKNILVNNSGKITCVLDWELSLSFHKFREIGKTIRDMDEWEGFGENIPDLLQGYGMSLKQYNDHKYEMFVFDAYIGFFDRDMKNNFLKNPKSENIQHYIKFLNRYLCQTN